MTIPTNMLKIPPPDSNNERQRRFCERNPGYYRKYSARQRAQVKWASAQHAALCASLQAAAQAEAAQCEPLMLPAPVETIEIPGMTTIARGEEVRVVEAVSV